MIQVQIASQITPLGVEGIRWVLVDPTDAGGAADPPAADALAAADLPIEPSAEGNLWSKGVLKLGVTGLGLGLALWTAQAWLGAPTAPGLAPSASQRAADRAAVPPPILAAPTPVPTPVPTLVPTPPPTLPSTASPASPPPPDWAVPAPTAVPAESAASAPAAKPLVTAELR